MPSNWSLMLFARVGVPYLLILDVYESFIQSNEHHIVGGAEATKRGELYENMVSLIEYWVAAAQKDSYGTAERANPARIELSRVDASGRFRPKLNALKLKIEGLPDSTYLLSRISTIETTLPFVTRTI